MNEIIINVEKNKKSVLLVNNGILVEKYQLDKTNESIEGNIYIGIIKDILKGMQAAFIDIGEGKNAFVHLEEILGKDYSNKDIEKLKIGMPVMVQVKKDAIDTKGARVVTNIQLSGRFCVLMPKENFITISQKIDDEKEKNRLLDIVKKKISTNYGVIIRTSAYKKSEEEIAKDLENLIKIWNKLNKKEYFSETTPKLLFKSLDVSKKMIIDMMDNQVERIIVNSKIDYNEIKNFLASMENVNIKLEYKEENLSNMYNIEHEIKETEKRKIWLKCGGFITIDKTEALTAIDVNSGKFVGKENLEKTVFRVNRDATIEIAKQLRLRDIGGIIIIDYIDMRDENNKNEIIKILTDNLKNDRAKTQVEGFTKLNLLEMTRKHLHS